MDFFDDSQENSYMNPDENAELEDGSLNPENYTEPILTQKENQFFPIPQDPENQHFEEEEEYMTPEEILEIKATEKSQQEAFVDMISTYFCENGPAKREETFPERYPIFYRVFTEPLEETHKDPPKVKSEEDTLIEMISELKIEGL